MKILIEGPFDSESQMNPTVRKAFAQVNRFMQGIDRRAKDEGVPDAAYEVLTKLSDQEKKAFLKILKSLTLLTSGSVELVRSGGHGWNPRKTLAWKHPFSNVSAAVATLLGFDINAAVTQEDYHQASLHLDQISERSNIEFVGRDEHPFASTDPDRVAAGKKGAIRDRARYNDQEISTLYRGFHSLPKNVIKYMVTVGDISLGRAASSSTDLSIAMDYSRRKKGGFSAIFVMDNPSKIGLDAREFSKFENESEVIIKGDFKVEKVYLKSYGKFDYSGKNLFADTVLAADGQESIFDSPAKQQMIDLINLGDSVNDYHLDALGHFTARQFLKGDPLFFVFKGTIT